MSRRCELEKNEFAAARRDAQQEEERGLALKVRLVRPSAQQVDHHCMANCTLGVREPKRVTEEHEDVVGNRVLGDQKRRTTAREGLPCRD